MDHIRFNTENRKHDKCKIVIGGHINDFSGVAGVIPNRAFCVLGGASHFWENKV